MSEHFPTLLLAQNAPENQLSYVIRVHFNLGAALRIVLGLGRIR